MDATLRQAEEVLFGVRSGIPGGGFVALRQVYDQYLEDRASLVDPLSQVGRPGADPGAI